MGEYGASASDVQAEFIWLSPEVGAGGPFGGDDGLGGYAPLAVATPDASATIELNWIYADHLGTPLIETDATGALATTPDDYLAPAFPGQSRLFADLYYNRYRDYDPTTGRYIEADPIGLGGGSNNYLYAYDNPVNLIDPLGRNALALPVAGEAGEGLVALCASSPIALAVCGGVAIGLTIYIGYELYQKFHACAPNRRQFEDDGELVLPSGMDGDNECEKQYNRDESRCTKAMIKYGRRGFAICIESAKRRYGQCISGRDLEPLTGVDRPIPRY